jgi:hypothetical protein
MPPRPSSLTDDGSETGDDTEAEADTADAELSVPGWPTEQPEPDQVLWPRRL